MRFRMLGVYRSFMIGPFTSIESPGRREWMWDDTTPSGYAFTTSRIVPRWLQGETGVYGRAVTPSPP